MEASFLVTDSRIQCEMDSLLIKENKIIPIPYSEIKKFPQNEISSFCVRNALYQLPITELIDFLKSEISSGLTIEIGAGNGCFGRALGIKMADNFMQTFPDVKALYESMMQPTINYGEDVENISGNDAVRK